MKTTAHFFLIFLLVFSMQAYNQVKQVSFELKGIASNYKPGQYVYIRYNDYMNKYVIDSTMIINDKFVIKGNISYPVMSYISNTKSSRIDKLLFLEPKKMTLIIDFNDFKSLQLLGSKTNDEYVQLQLEKKKQNQNLIEQMDVDFAFINNHPSSFVSPFLFRFWVSRIEGRAYIDKMDSIYNNFSKEIKNSTIGIDLKKDIINLKKSTIGSIAPSIIVKDINNDYLSLESYKNNEYILLDFWASWCGPCRADFPFVKEIYSSYKEKGFEVISISTDEDIEKWHKAVEMEEIKIWKNISEKQNNNSIKKDYSVSAIPFKVLIDKQGIIIGRWEGSSDENKEELKKMLQNIFDK